MSYLILDTLSPSQSHSAGASAFSEAAQRAALSKRCSTAPTSSHGSQSLDMTDTSGWQGEVDGARNSRHDRSQPVRSVHVETGPTARPPSNDEGDVCTPLTAADEMPSSTSLEFAKSSLALGAHAPQSLLSSGVLAPVSSAAGPGLAHTGTRGSMMSSGTLFPRLSVPITAAAQSIPSLSSAIKPSILPSTSTAAGASAQPAAAPPLASVQPTAAPPLASAQPAAGPPLGSAQPAAAPPLACAQPAAAPPLASVQPAAAPPLASVQPTAAPPLASVALPLPVASPAPARRGARGDGSGRSGQLVSGGPCEECGAKKSTLFRKRADGAPLCNACGLRYSRSLAKLEASQNPAGGSTPKRKTERTSTGVGKDTSDKTPKKVRRRLPPDEKRWCRQCGVTSSPQWRYVDSELACNACALRSQRRLERKSDGRSRGRAHVDRACTAVDVALKSEPSSEAVAHDCAQAGAGADSRQFSGLLDVVHAVLNQRGQPGAIPAARPLCMSCP